MSNEPWVAAAVTTDAMVADLLLHIKRSSPTPSTPAPPLNLNPPGWGDHKYRSKPSAISNSTVDKGQQRSPSNRCRGATVTMSLLGVQIIDPARLICMKIRKESGSEIENMKRRRCMLPDLNETPAPGYV